jgi:two-component system sensor histidine kinase VicK
VLGDILSEDALRETLKGYRGISQEITLRRPVYRALRAQFAPLRNEDGRLAGTVVVFQDITDQERLESLRKEFVANVSHELRTPLTTIKSYVETLLDGAMEDRDLRPHFLEVVDEETDRMVRLVNNLLDLSTLDYEGANLEMKPFSLAGAIRDAVEALAVQSKKRGMAVSIEAPPGPLTALGDRERIQQVVMNLISNAIKFTPEGGDVRISILQADGWYRVSVKDNGIGIPKEEIPRIFDRFYRVDKARSRQLGGTGLGLSIARQIVEAHGGQVEIKSEMGEGTIVTFTLRADAARLVDSHEGKPA